MVRWMCSFGHEDRISAEEPRTSRELVIMREYLQDRRQWLGHPNKK